MKRRNFYKTFQDASEIGFPREAAANLRIAYLKKRLRLYKRFDPTTFSGRVAYTWQKEILDEIEFLEKNKVLANSTLPDRLSQEQIHQARNFPVTELVELNRSKKAKAWCHEDKNPSLYLMSRVNRLFCPVCNKSFDSIDTAMHVRGLSFVEAVKSLI